jgi:hypothetical protein
MVIGLPHESGRQRGALTTEMLVALALVLGLLLPLAYSIVSERKLVRACYQRAVAMEIVDGEVEALVAGEWRAFSAGAHEYSVRARSATNLPPGQFLLTVGPNRIRLQWQPASHPERGQVVREAMVK